MREHYGGFVVTDVEECLLLRDSSDSSDKHPKAAASKPRLRGAELRNVLLLLFLYVLQGVPLGLAGSIPLILQSRSVSYTDQAFFSLVFWPFSLKLLWAPLVDALYVRRVGRRKTWLVPTQYLLGLFMLYLSVTAETLLQGPSGGPHAGEPDVLTLTAVFFALAFLAATQDIAVDGWALTMLSRDNVGLASTCNSVGQTAGYFLGNVFFLVLESADFCNAYLRSAPRPKGLLTLSGFLFFWGVTFLVSTTLMALFKKEKKGTPPTRSSSEQQQRSCFFVPPSEKKHQRLSAAPGGEEPQGVLQTYRLLFHIVRTPQVSALCGLLLTAKVGFSAAEAVTGLKLMEAGVPKERLAVLAVVTVPLQLALPLLISRYTAGPRPLDLYLRAFPFRLAMGLVYAALVWWTPHALLKEEEEEGGGGGFPVYYYGLLLAAYGLQQGALYSMHVSSMAFFTQVSDPLIGGTYMTLLNTVTNLGGVWPSTLALWLVDPLTVRECRRGALTGDGAGGGAGGGAIIGGGQSCGSAQGVRLCVAGGGACVKVLDGYYLEAAVCFALGLAWWAWLGKRMRRLQDQSPATWRCKMNH